MAAQLDVVSRVIAPRPAESHLLGPAKTAHGAMEGKWGGPFFNEATKRPLIKVESAATRPQHVRPDYVGGGQLAGWYLFYRTRQNEGVLP